MGDELEFTWAKSDDLGAYEAFVRETFGIDSIQAIPGRARWLFWNNPLGLHVALCRHSGRLVAACGHLPVPARNSGVLAGCGIDMMVAPQWRRRGIGRRFLAMRLERFPISLSSGQSREMYQVYAQAGAVDLGAFHLARWRRSLIRPRLSRSWLGDAMAWMCPRLRGSQVVGRRRPITVAEASGMLRAASTRVTELRCGVQWAEWFDWRYDGPVYHDYRCWEMNRGCQFLGLLVTRRSAGREWVIDCVADAADLPALIAATALSSTEPEVSVLIAGDRLTSTLARAGFLVRPRNSRLILMVNTENPADVPIRSEDLDFFAGFSDSDLIRWP